MKELSNTYVTFEAQDKKKLNNTEAVLKKSVAHKKSVYIENFLSLIVRKCCELSNIIYLACDLYILLSKSYNFLFIGKNFLIFLILNPNLQDLIL